MNEDDFTFEEDRHKYFDGAGLERPSVTGTLKTCEIFDYSMVDPVLLERKRLIGQNVHAWTAEYDRCAGRIELIDPHMLTDEEKAYGYGWPKFIEALRPQFIEIEKGKMGLLGGIRVGGTPDRIALINRRLWVVDIKCSSMMHAGWGLQLADYEMLHTGRDAVGIMGRMVVRLPGNGKWSMRSFPDPVDGTVALAAARWAVNPGDELARSTVVNWRKNMRVYRDPDCAPLQN